MSTLMGSIIHFIVYSILSCGVSEEENRLYLLELGMRIDGREEACPLEFESFINSSLPMYLG